MMGMFPPVKADIIYASFLAKISNGKACSKCIAKAVT